MFGKRSFFPYYKKSDLSLALFYYIDNIVFKRAHNTTVADFHPNHDDAEETEDDRKEPPPGRPVCDK